MKAKSRFFTLIAVASLLVLLFCTPAVTVYAETPSVPVTAPTESAPDETPEESEETPQEPSGGAQEPAEAPVDAFAEEVDQLPDTEEPASPAPSAEPTEGVTEEQPTTEPEEPTTDPETPTEDEPSDAVQQFIDGLKKQYGNNWTTYYNAILAEWGTVENYLMSLLPDDSPDVVKDAWLAFVAWTRDNWTILAAIGATIAACAGVVLYVVLKRKANAFMQKKFNNIYDEYNKQSAAIKAQNAMLIAMSGSNPRFEEQRNALKATANALDEASEEK